MRRLTKSQINRLPEWLPLKGYDGLYEVNCREGIVRNNVSGHIYRSPKVPLVGYGQREKRRLHLIIAETAFGYYGIQINGLLVKYIDGDETNKSISNIVLKLTKSNGKVIKSSRKRAVAAIKDGKIAMIFPSIREAERQGFISQNISSCCKKENQTHKGYNWKYLS